VTSASAVTAPSPRKKEVDQRACVLCGVRSDDHQEVGITRVECTVKEVNFTKM
jgi:hypothetical protein